MTVTGRKMCREMIVKINGKNSEAIVATIADLQKWYGSLFHKVFKTITADV